MKTLPSTVRRFLAPRGARFRAAAATRVSVLCITMLSSLGLASPRAEEQHRMPPVQKDVALVGVNILPMDRPDILTDQTIIVRSGRIATVGPRTSTTVPDDVESHDMTGLWVTPGLADMHVHIFGAEELPFYLRHGVTTVRNLWGWDLHLRLRAEISVGEAVGPRIYTSGRLLDGDPPQLRGSAALSTPAQARDEVVRQVQAGFDGLKVYDRLTAPVYGAVVMAARRHGLPVWGHVPDQVGIDATLAAGQRTLEHLSGVLEAAAPAAAESGWAADLEGSLLADLAVDMRAADVVVVPTLVVHSAMEYTPAKQLALKESSAVLRLPAQLRRFCCETVRGQDLSDQSQARRRAHRAQVVRALHEAGVMLVAGSDTGNPWLIPGASLHEEIRLLHEAGLPPLDALQAATLNAAFALNASAHWGAVAVGRSADLLVLRSNPLDNLSVLSDPEIVIAQGRWYTRALLRQMTGESDQQ